MKELYNTRSIPSFIDAKLSNYIRGKDPSWSKNLRLNYELSGSLFLKGGDGHLLGLIWYLVLGN